MNQTQICEGWTACLLADYCGLDTAEGGLTGLPLEWAVPGAEIQELKSCQAVCKELQVTGMKCTSSEIQRVFHRPRVSGVSGMRCVYQGTVCQTLALTEEAVEAFCCHAFLCTAVFFSFLHFEWLFAESLNSILHFCPLGLLSYFPVLY